MNNLDEMMNLYHWDGTTILPSEPLTDQEKNRILHKTLEKCNIPDIKHPLLNRDILPTRDILPNRDILPTRSILPKRKLWVIAAACILILAMATVSFAAIALDKSFLDFFAPKNPQQANRLNSIAATIDKQVTSNGVTLDVREAAGDNNAVYVLFDIIAPEGTILDQPYYYFQSSFVDLAFTHSAAGYYFEQLADPTPKDNRISMMLCYTAEKKLTGKTMRMNLVNLVIPKNAEEMALVDALPPRTQPGTPGDAYDSNKVVIDGTWEIEFPLTYPDSSTTIKPKTTIDIFGGTCSIKELRYSAISATLTIQGDAIAKYDAAPPQADAVLPDMQVLLKDGRTVPTGGCSQSIEKNKLVATCQFSEIIDPNDIVSITFNGVCIPIDSGAAK